MSASELELAMAINRATWAASNQDSLATVQRLDEIHSIVREVLDLIRSHPDCLAGLGRPVMMRT